MFFTCYTKKALMPSCSFRCCTVRVMSRGPLCAFDVTPQGLLKSLRWAYTHRSAYGNASFATTCGVLDWIWCVLLCVHDTRRDEYDAVIGVIRLEMRVSNVLRCYLTVDICVLHFVQWLLKCRPAWLHIRVLGTLFLSNGDATRSVWQAFENYVIV